MPTIEQITGQGEGIIVNKSDFDVDRIDDEEEDLDETMVERLIGLTEMFPESVRNVTTTLASWTYTGVHTAYNLGRSGLWVAASSATILALPVMFEMERSQMEEQQLQQQRQVLLGPNAAGQGLMPQVMPPRPS